MHLREAAERMFAEELADRCLPFDCRATAEYALLVADQTRAGRPVSTEDGQIAAVALANGMAVATGNICDFEGISCLELLDPWQAN